MSEGVHPIGPHAERATDGCARGAGVVAMPATPALELRGSVGAPVRGRHDPRELVIGIRLDPGTLAWTDEGDHASVAYDPERGSGAAYDPLQDVTHPELRAKTVSPNALRVAGRLEATPVWREGAFQVRDDPSRTVSLTADLEADPVVGDEALAAPLEP